MVHKTDDINIQTKPKVLFFNQIINMEMPKTASFKVKINIESKYFF